MPKIFIRFHWKGNICSMRTAHTISFIKFSFRYWLHKTAFFLFFFYLFFLFQWYILNKTSWCRVTLPPTIARLQCHFSFIYWQPDDAAFFLFHTSLYVISKFCPSVFKSVSQKLHIFLNNIIILRNLKEDALPERQSLCDSSLFLLPWLMGKLPVLKFRNLFWCLRQPFSKINKVYHTSEKLQTLCKAMWFSSHQLHSDHFENTLWQTIAITSFFIVNCFLLRDFEV